MSVTYPKGFRAAGVTAGVKPSGAPDLGLLVADAGVPAAGVFTTNAFRAAPVELTAGRLAVGTAQAVVVNSGQANAATGPAGLRGAARLTDAVAAHLRIDPELVLACSTGVIGEPLHLEELVAAVPGAVDALRDDGGDAFATAIMTTDTVTKQARVDAGAFRVGGAAKGVGMVAPDLATMLAFVTTDAVVAPAAVHELTTSVLEPVFESVTVDASTSTNDTVLLLASGVAGGAPITPGSTSWEALVDAVTETADALVEQIAADAEGGTHVVLVDVHGASSAADARRIARAVADSPLVKTAVFGGDPNPGRLLQAVGAAGVAIDPGSVDIDVNGVTIVRGGVIPAIYFDPSGDEPARAAMKEAHVRFAVRVGDGPGAGRVLGCDLSYDYVRINGEYTT